jgi:hypothetical protein
MSDALPDTRDLLDFLQDCGYDESDPHLAQVLLQFLLGTRISKNPEEIVNAMRILCNSLTSARKEMQRYVRSQREVLVKLEQELGLVKAAEDKP